MGALSRFSNTFLHVDLHIQDQKLPFRTVEVALQIHHLALESNYRLQDQRPNEKMIPSFWQQKENPLMNLSIWRAKKGTN
jgi:hypothetical protein